MPAFEKYFVVSPVCQDEGLLGSFQSLIFFFFGSKNQTNLQTSTKVGFSDLNKQQILQTTTKVCEMALPTNLHHQLPNGETCTPKHPNRNELTGIDVMPYLFCLSFLVWFPAV